MEKEGGLMFREEASSSDRRGAARMQAGSRRNERRGSGSCGLGGHMLAGDARRRCRKGSS